MPNRVLVVGFRVVIMHGGFTGGSNRDLRGVRITSTSEFGPHWQGVYIVIARQHSKPM